MRAKRAEDLLCNAVMLIQAWVGDKMLVMRQFFVYILASKSHRLYVGVTNDIERRMYEHRAGWSSFTARYHIDRLVHLEARPHPMQAIRREKAIKRLRRADKITLIERRNPHWNDLADRWLDQPLPADPRDIDY